MSLDLTRSKYDSNFFYAIISIYQILSISRLSIVFLHLRSLRGMIFKKGENRRDWLVAQHFENRKRVSNSPPIGDSLRRAERSDWLLQRGHPKFRESQASSIQKSNGAIRDAVGRIRKIAPCFLRFRRLIEWVSRVEHRRECRVKCRRSSSH